MLISDERINHLAHTIAQTLLRDGMITTRTPDQTTQEIKRALIKYCQVEVAIDLKVRTKIASLKRGVAEGSREWDVMYQKLYDEELAKR